MGGITLCRTAVITFVVALSWGCHVGGVGDEPSGDPDDPHHDSGHETGRHTVLLSNPELPDPDSDYEFGMTVNEAAVSACSTSTVAGLSRQLIEEIECLRPNSMADITGIPGVSISTFPFLQRSAALALSRAAEAGGSITINSALRSTVQQYVLYKWYTEGLCTSVVSLAAPPGRSNHESGLALDVGNYSSWKSRLEAEGFSWLGGNDPVHFDYQGGGDDLRALSVEAFQRLWNRNYPDDPIGVDGAYGPETGGAIGDAPADGFEFGASCD